MRDMPFTAVVLGGDMNCYGVARTFYEAYGIGTLMAGKTPIFPTAESRLVTGYYDRDIMKDEVLLRLLTEIQRDYPDKKKILLGSNDDYVRQQAVSVDIPMKKGTALSNLREPFCIIKFIDPQL